MKHSNKIKKNQTFENSKKDKTLKTIKIFETVERFWKLKIFETTENCKIKSFEKLDWFPNYK